ncbi:MAG: MFS transporter [Candidatus Bathyarchaeales archaeon]
MENAVNSKALVGSLRFLFASVFFMQMLTGVVGLTVPIYAASLGASPLLVGVIGATGGLTYSFMPLAAGMLSDKIRRKIFVLTAMILYSLSCGFYILTENTTMLIPVKALEWVAVAIFWPSTEALITEFSGKKLEQNLKKFNLSWGSATIIGPIIGGSLISLSGIKAPFFLSLAVSFVLALLAAMAIKEQRKNLQKPKQETHNQKNSAEPIAPAVVSIILFSFIAGIIYNLFPAQATNLNMPAYEIGLIIFANGLFRLAAFTQAYKMEAKIGKTRMFLVGALALALASALTAASSTALFFALAFSIFGLGMGILYAASIAHILKNRSHATGYAAGLFESLIGVGNFLGSSAGGLASEYFSSNTPYILSLLISLAVVAYQSLRLKKQNASPP